MALLIAILACGSFYTLASAPPPPSGPEQTQMVSTMIAEQSITPVDPLTQQPTSLTSSQATQIPLDGSSKLVYSPTQETTADSPYLYYTQAGDSLKTIAIRFGVKPEEVTSPEAVPQTGLINPKQLLIIPRKLTNTSSSTLIIPDSEVVYSPTAADFDVAAYVKQAGGYLNQYSEYLGTTGMTNGAQVIQRVATEFSVNPRLLLALLDYQSHWVTGQPANDGQKYYPMGLMDVTCLDPKNCLYMEMSQIVSLISQGYYGWRDGSVTMVTFPDKSTLRLAPDLNAGSVALQFLFAKLYNLQEWAGVLNPVDGFKKFYAQMFGDPFLRAQTVEPLFPATLTQPDLVLPFEPGVVWSFTGGPHAAFGTDKNGAGALAALDFSPGGAQSGCYTSEAWVDASATGVVVRAEHNQVVIDLDGDGYEQTGWTILYMHIATDGMIAKGTKVSVGDRLGHPSCEGGVATGVNLHVARKYNGEWILADSAIPFDLSGWIAHAGSEEYQGTLTQGDQTLTACPCSAPNTWLSRPKS